MVKISCGGLIDLMAETAIDANRLKRLVSGKKVVTFQQPKTLKEHIDRQALDLLNKFMVPLVDTSKFNDFGSLVVLTPGTDDVAGVYTIPDSMPEP